MLIVLCLKAMYNAKTANIKVNNSKARINGADNYKVNITAKNLGAIFLLLLITFFFLTKLLSIFFLITDKSFTKKLFYKKFVSNIICSKTLTYDSAI